MSWMVMLTQVALPLSLLLWLAAWPARGIISLALQIMSVGAALSGLSLAALWTLPPFWTPWLYGSIYLIIILLHWRRGRFSGNRLWNARPAQTLVLILASGLGLIGGYMTFQSVAGRGLPDQPVVDIAPPFGPGTYLVAHGGSTPMVNVHLKTLDPSIERLRDWKGQSRALDIFRISPLGLHKDGWLPTAPSRYETFGVPVLAPCEGHVAKVVDRYEDMPVPVMDPRHKAGNYVAVDCGSFYVILAHLRQDSVIVEEGEAVALGAQLGQMGNSGNSSEPHLHVHAQKGLPENAPFAGEPLGLTLEGRHLVRNDRIDVLP